MNAITLVLLVATQISLATFAGADEARLSPEDEATVRRVVYRERARQVGSQLGHNFEVVVPVALSDFYAKKPDAVLDLLEKIIAGGNPTDSVSAAAYAISLLEHPGVGEVCLSLFDAETYDEIDKNWQCPPRQHWQNHVKRCREEKHS